MAAAAAEALGLPGKAFKADAEDAAAHARKRMRELSMLVHPDKCSLPGAEQVTAMSAAQLLHMMLRRMGQAVDMTSCCVRILAARPTSLHVKFTSFCEHVCGGAHG